MSFAVNANNVRVEEGRWLVAELQNVNGDHVESRFDLDTVLGNSYGSFTWGGEGFSGSASDVTLSIEGADGIPVLRANLDNGQGEKNYRDVNLGERIQNNDGNFVYN